MNFEYDFTEDFFLRGPINIKPVLVHIIAWCKKKPLSHDVEGIFLAFFKVSDTADHEILQMLCEKACFKSA